MTKIKLTKSVVDAAKAQTSDVELRDTIVPGFLCKVTPTGCKVFMLQYRMNSGMRRKPALGQAGDKISLLHMQVDSVALSKIACAL